MGIGGGESLVHFASMLECLARFYSLLCTTQSWAGRRRFFLLVCLLGSSGSLFSFGQAQRLFLFPSGLIYILVCIDGRVIYVSIELRSSFNSPHGRDPKAKAESKVVYMAYILSTSSAFTAKPLAPLQSPLQSPPTPHSLYTTKTVQK